MQENGKSDLSQAGCTRLQDIAEDDMLEEDAAIGVIPVPPPPPPPISIEFNNNNGNLTGGIALVPSFRVSSTMSSSDQPVSSSSSSHAVGAIKAEEIIQRGRTLRKSNMVRTPGGTPIRSDIKDNKPAVTAQDMIAQALQKRFKSANQHASSPLKPQTDASDEEWTEDV